MLWAWLVAAWSPLTYGWAAYVGESMFMVADLLRRSSELAALVLAWYVYRRARVKNVDSQVYRRWERYSNTLLAAVMLFSVIVILIRAYARLLDPAAVGQVGWGVLIGFLGVIVNGWFWRRYVALASGSYSALAESQWRLFRSKTMLDGWGIISLGSALLFQSASWGRYIDPIGAFVPAAVLLVSALQILGLHYKRGVGA